MCYTKPLDSLKCWNDHFFCVDSFACPASFSWNTAKNVSKDPFPKSTKFRADDYTFLAAHPAPFLKFLEPFLCLIGMSRHYTLDEDTYPTFLHEDGTDMDLFSFIRVADPTKVKVGERERAEEEARLLETTIWRVDPLLPVAPARAERDSATGGDQETQVDVVTGVRFVDAENVAVEKPKRPRKKRQADADASGPSHPPKKLRSNHGTSGGAASAGKSPTVFKQLLASSILNVESRVEALATLPFVTSSVSATLEHESGVPADSITGLNLRTVGASARFVISLDSSHHSSTNFSKAEGDSIIRSVVVPPVMTEAVTTTHVASIPSDMAPEPGAKVTATHAFMFHDSESTGMVRPDIAGSSHPSGKELSMGSQEVDSENLHEVFVPRWNIPNDSLLDNLEASREFIDHLAPSLLFAQIRNMDYDELFTEFSVGTARQACLSAKVRMRTEYCLSERRRLESESERQAGLLKSRDEEIKNLKAQLLLKEVEAARLRTRVSAFEAAKQVHIDEINTLKQKNVALEDEKESLNGKVAELQSLVSVKDRELKDVDATVTSLKSQNDVLADQVHALEISSSGLQEKVTVYENCMEQLEKWLLTQGMELAVVKCLNSPEYLFVLIAAISKAIEKELQSVNFSLLAELKANKDASAETLMDLLRLEEPFAERLGLHELQPTFDQLIVPIHYSPNQTVIGATALSLALDVSNIRVQKIGENIVNQRSALRDVFVPLAEPFFSAALVGTEGTSGVIHAAAHTTTALSMTLALASTVPPITIEDYEFIGAGGPEGTQGSGEVASFPPSVKFEKEELDITPERDPPS
ncbi:hypothetical protein Tco_0415323 [Tanacetum coccineum]